MTKPIGPYARPKAWSQLSTYSDEACFLRRVRREMSNHVGGSPNAAQHAIIDRIAWLRLRIAAMDAKVDPTAVMNAHDTATYLAWSNTLGRLIERLGPAVPVPKKPSKHAPIPHSTRAERQAAMLAKETTR